MCRYMCVCNTIFHELGGEYMGFHLLLSMIGCLKYFKSDQKKVTQKRWMLLCLFSLPFIMKIFIQ